MADAQAAGKKGAEASSEKAAPSPHAKRSTWGASPNPLSYIFFFFVSPLISRGYKVRLEPDDLYETDDVKAENLHTMLEKSWAEERKKEKPSLIKAMVSGHAATIAFTAFLYVIGEATNFAGPLLLREILDGLACRAFSVPSVDDGCPSQNTMYLYALGLFVGPLVQSIASNHCIYLLNKKGVSLRNALMCAVYRKCLVLDNAGVQKHSTGKIVTLMSNDCEKLMMIAPMIHAVWGSPIFIAATMVLLYDVISWSTFVGLGVMFLVVPFTGKLAMMLGAQRQKIVKQTDKRVGIMNEIINGIRIIKFYAWEKSFLKSVAAVRDAEVTIMRKTAIIGAGFGVLMFATPVFTGLAAIGSYALAGNELTVSRVYTSLVLFNMLRFPLAFLPMVINMVIQARVSMRRVQEFLEAGEVTDRAASSGDRSLRIVGGEFVWDAVPEVPSSTEPSKDSKEGSKDGPDTPGGSTRAPAGPVLRDIDFEAQPGSLTMVVGSVGSGKSSFLATFINSLTKTKGDVHVGGSIAYVSQTAWILNDTVQKNVTFGLPLDKARYAHATKVAQLSHDLDLLPFGDQTEIGERGVTLSGGQKQRVSIARAVYADADIVLLDDPLSAVDTHVGAALFEQCITGALKGKTVVLVTNALQYLPNADQVVVIDGGKISEMGSYASLIGAGVGFAALMADNNIQEEDDDVIDDDTAAYLAAVDTAKEAVRASADGRAGKSGSKSVSFRPLSTDHGRGSRSTDRARGSVSIDHNRKSTDRPHLSKLDSKGIVVEEDRDFTNVKNLTGEESRQTGSVSLDVWMAYMRAGGGWLLGLSVLVTFGLEMGSMAIVNRWLGLWANNTYNQGKWFYLGWYFALAVINAVFIGLRAVNFTLGCVRATKVLNLAMTNHVMRFPSWFFDTTPTGRILNRFSKDTDVIDSTLPGILIQMIACFANITTTLVVISVATPWFLCALVPIIIVYRFLQRYYIPTSRELQRIEAIKRSPIYSHFSESVNGLSTIRAYQQGQHFVRLNDAKCDEDASALLTQKLAAAWLSMRLELIGTVTVFLAAFLAVNGNVDPGLAGLSLAYALEITRFLKHGTTMMSEAETQMNGVERVREYTGDGPHPLEAAADLPGDNSLPEGWPNRGAINVSGLVMRYRPDTPLVLKDLDLDIKAGEKIGICGRTGSGKSSLFLALFRIVEPLEGRVTLDGVDTKKIGLHKLRSAMAMIPQDPFMFSGSVRTNIDPFGEYTDEKIWASLARVGLKPVVEESDEKLDMKVVDNGDNFSQGQRQLFCMARALLRNSPVLMMDEATASVDVESDKLIQKVVREEFKHCTILTIAHRLNTIMDSDRVLVMADGKVGEFGTPLTLLEKDEGQFASLVDQTGKKNSAYLRSLSQKSFQDKLGTSTQEEEEGGGGKRRALRMCNSRQHPPDRGG